MKVKTIALLGLTTLLVSSQSYGQLSNPNITAITGDCTAFGSGSVPITCTKTSGTTFAPSAIVDATNASNINAGTLSNTRLATGAAAANLGFTPLNPANNLSDLATPTTARTNLGLGSIATQSASAVTVTGGSIVGTSITMPTFTVSTLPTCNAGAKGTTAFVTDALTPVFLAALTGGGSSPALALCTGVAWVGA